MALLNAEVVIVDLQSEADFLQLRVRLVAASFATGGLAFGATSTRSSPASSARRSASSTRTTPTCSPPGPTRRTSGTRIRSLMRVSLMSGSFHRILMRVTKSLRYATRTEASIGSTHTGVDRRTRSPAQRPCGRHPLWREAGIQVGFLRLRSGLSPRRSYQRYQKWRETARSAIIARLTLREEHSMPVQRSTGAISTRSAEAMRRGLAPTAFRASDSASFIAEASAP